MTSRIMGRFRDTGDDVVEPEWHPIVVDVIVWAASMLAVPVLLDRWASGAFIAVWIVCHTVIYFGFVWRERSQELSGRLRALRTALSTAIWSSVPVSAVVVGSYGDQEFAVLCVVISFVGLRALVPPTSGRRRYEVDGPTVAMIAACCSLTVGTTLLGLAGFAMAIFYLLAEHGQIAGFLRYEADRASLRSSLQAMRELAHTDQLTGIGNRRAAVERLRAGQPGPGLVLLFDLDRFKEVNDRHGYLAGDQVLVAVAGEISSRLGDSWELFRLGGDEFLGVRRGTVAVPSDAFEAVDVRITSFDGAELSISVEVSAGVVELDWPMGVEAVTSRLVPLLRRAKRRRGSLHEDVVAAGQGGGAWQASVVEAMQSDAFKWWGQPIVDLATGDPTGIELLCRWPQPDGSVVEPVDFLAVLGTEARSRQLARAAIQAAAEWFDALERIGPGANDVRLHVNVLPRNLEVALLDSIDQFLCIDHQRRLCIEILESEYFEIGAAALDVLRRLRDRGIGIVIDDFGAGYSNFAEFGSAAFDAVKLDRGLVTDLDTNERRQKVIEHLDSMFRELDVEVVAEGVEDEALWSTLVTCGVRFGQGSHFGSAVPLERVATIV